MAANLQQKVSADTGSNPKQTLTATLPDPTTKGNIMVMGASLNDQGNDKIVFDEPPRGFVKVKGAKFGRVTSVMWIHLCDGTSDDGEVTVNLLGGGNRDIAMTVAEYSNLAAIAIFDKTASNSGNSNNPSTSNTDTTTRGDELWVAVLANESSDSQTSPASGFTKQANPISANTSSGSRISQGFYDKVVSATGAAGTNVHLGSAKNWTGIVATFYGNTVIPEMPAGAVHLRFEKDNRLLGPTNVSDSIFAEPEYDSLIPGGYGTFDFKVPAKEVTNNKKVYRYNATVTLRHASNVSANQDPDALVWQGYLLTPMPSDTVYVDGHADVQGGWYQLSAVGWRKYIEERQKPMLWQVRGYEGISGLDGDPFVDFHNSDQIDFQVGKGALTWKIPGKSEIKHGRKAGGGWWDQDHRIKRVAGRIFQNTDMPGKHNKPHYSLRMYEYSGPSSPNSAHKIVDFDNKTQQKDGDDFDQDIGGGGAQMFTFELFRTGPPTKSTNQTFKIGIKDLRMNDLAPGDSYSAKQVIDDLAKELQFDTSENDPYGQSMVQAKLGDGSTDVFNIMPLWWQEGSWADLFDYLAAAYAFKWAIWEIGNKGPIIEFRGWNRNTTWYVNAMGPSAFAKADVQPSEDVFSDIVVLYRQSGSPKLRRIEKEVNPNPFRGLDPWRQRTFSYTIQDQQPNDSLAKDIAHWLAIEHSQLRWEGTITLSYAYRDGKATPADEMRAGDLVYVQDFMNIPQQFRMYGVKCNGKTCEINVGRKPRNVGKLLWWARLRKMYAGRLSSFPSSLDLP